MSLAFVRGAGVILIVSAQQWLGTCVKSGQLLLVAPVTALTQALRDGSVTAFR